MENDEFMGRRDIQVFYPVWVKVLGIVGIPSLAAIGVWLSLSPLLDGDESLTKQLFMFIIGVAVLYQCYIGGKFLGSLNTVITLNEDGVSVHKRGVTHDYSWDSLLVDYYSFATTVHIRHKSGKSIGYFSDNLENLGLLTNAIDNNGI